MFVLSSSWSNKKRPVEALSLFIGFYILDFLLVNYIPELPIIKQIQFPYFGDFLLTIIQLLIIILLLYVMKKLNFQFSEQRFHRSLKTMVLLGIIAGTSILVNEVVLKIVFPTPPLAKLPFDERTVSFFTEFGFAIITGPLFEEFLFRGLLLKYVFTNRPVLGVIISSFLFVLAHRSTGLIDYWYLGVPSIILGLVYNYTKSIKVPIYVHMALNFIAHVKMKFF